MSPSDVLRLTRWIDGLFLIVHHCVADLHAIDMKNNKFNTPKEMQMAAKSMPGLEPEPASCDSSSVMSKFTGLFVASLTPFKDGAVDLASIPAYIRYLENVQKVDGSVQQPHSVFFSLLSGS